jgi:hypothetical protein
MKFGDLGRIFQRRRRSRLAGNGLRGTLLTAAGMMAWRWWQSRQAARRVDPDPIGRDPRQSYDTGQASQNVSSF